MHIYITIFSPCQQSHHQMLPTVPTATDLHRRHHCQQPDRVVLVSVSVYLSVRCTEGVYMLFHVQYAYLLVLHRCIMCAVKPW